jgi:HAD superfamily hydrolase (TIGR01450 family)
VSAQAPFVRFDELVARYDLMLFDAYGVLVHGTGLMPGARNALCRLDAEGKPYFVVTNDASRLPVSASARYRGMGLSLDPGRILTSGLLITTHFREAGLSGSRCAVLGPQDSVEYVRMAGGEITPVSAPFDVLVICDESGFPFLETVDATLTNLIRLIDGGRAPRLLLPNPDILYPDGIGAFGFAAGSVALMFEAALARRYPGRDDLRFTRLGKPHPAIYEEALALGGTRNAVMFGDQIETDIAGANAAGIDSVLMTQGVSGSGIPAGPDTVHPTYQMDRLS